MPSAQSTPSPARFDVKQFGAMADGLTVDTSAINRAINAAAANRGGEVYFPAGRYRCFSIHLKSNIAIRFEPGATLIAAIPGQIGGYDDVTAEPEGMHQDYGHSHWANSLIHGEGLENIQIRGPGLLIGTGLTTAFPGVAMQAASPGIGNKAIALKNCRGVSLSDFTIQEGGHFAVLATGSDNLTIDGLLIDTNRDGIDIDCCRDVRISNCKVNSPFDDAICLKSSYALGYPRTTERVTVRNCEVSGFELGSLIDGRRERRWPNSPWPEDGLQPRAPTGRIKLGTESNGGFRDITIVNCTFDNCRGFALETVDGGVLEDVRIAKISMRNITAAPFLLRLGSRMRAPPRTQVGSMRRISVENVVCTNSVASLSSIISGIPGHYIQDLTLTDIHIEHAGGITIANVPAEPPEQENAYPEAGMFGPIVPSQGFFVRHVRGIQISRVEVRSKRDDERPIFALHDVDRAHFTKLQARLGVGRAMFTLRKVTGFSMSRCPGFENTRRQNVDIDTI